MIQIRNAFKYFTCLSWNHMFVLRETYMSCCVVLKHMYVTKKLGWNTLKKKKKKKKSAFYREKFCSWDLLQWQWREDIKLWQHCLDITKTAAFWKIILWMRAHLFVRYIRSYTVLQHKCFSGCIISWRTMMESRSFRRNVMQTMDNISIFNGFNTFVDKKYCFLFFNGNLWTFYPSAMEWIHLAIAISL